PPVQKHKSCLDLQFGTASHQAFENLFDLLAAADVSQSQGEALALQDQVGGGVGVEVSRAALGLAADQFVGVGLGLAVVGLQMQVDGQAVLLAAEVATQ